MRPLALTGETGGVIGTEGGDGGGKGGEEVGELLDSLKVSGHCLTAAVAFRCFPLLSVVPFRCTALRCTHCQKKVREAVRGTVKKVVGQSGTAPYAVSVPDIA
eukprot:291070-Rhodomonas_salina.2